MISFDYIIVGGGTAGCVLADRLSEDGTRSVLLLEAGGKRYNPWIHLPVGYFKTVFDPKLGWGYRTQPEPNLAGRSVVWPRGRVLGGTGAINGMVYIRGQKEDFDHWRQLGNHGWGYDDVLPYFRRSERQASTNRSTEAQYHGADGPLTVSDYPDRNVLCHAFIEAAGQVGIRPNTDFNGRRQEGAGYYQITTRRGLRADTAAAYLSPARRRTNLKIITNTLVTSIRLEQSRATGVTYRRADRVTSVGTNAEVILCGGAVNSPQILQLSGIGDGAHLGRLGIMPTVDLPGVGKNLQDHLQAQLVFRSRQPVTINDDLKSVRRKAALALRYLTRREGPIAGGPAPAGAFLRSAPDVERADLQIHFLPFSLSRPAVLDTFSGFTFNINQSRPRSRGEVSISSANPREAPLIQPNYLADPIDQSVLVAGLKLGRTIAEARAFDDYRDSEIKPGAEAQSDDEILDHIRQTAGSIYHPVGTCRMGSEADAVVDQELRVRGVQGLRVADASVMPTLVSGNTNAATIMIAEKAADLIRNSGQSG